VIINVILSFVSTYIFYVWPVVGIDVTQWGGGDFQKLKLPFFI